MDCWRITKNDLKEALLTLKPNTYFCISDHLENWLCVTKLKLGECAELYICTDKEASFKTMESDINKFVDYIFVNWATANTFMYAKLDIKNIGE